MSWHYKLPQNFPAIYVEALTAAVADPYSPVILWSSKHRTECLSFAETFRYFKWCIRKEPKATDLFNTLNSFNFRTNITQDEVGYVLYLTATPTKLLEFIRLNPILAREVLPLCQ